MSASIIVVVLALSFASAAHAQSDVPPPLALGTDRMVAAAPTYEEGDDEEEDAFDAARYVGFVDIGFFVGSLDESGEVGAVAIAPVIGGHVRALDALEIGGAWGMSFASISSGAESGSGVRGANPFLFAHYIGSSSATTYRVGAGFTIPVSTGPELDDVADGVLGPDRLAGLLGQGYASAARGRWDLWIWAVDRAALVLPSVRLSFRAGVPFLRLETALGLLFYTGDTTFDGFEIDVDTAIVWQSAFEVGVEQGAGRVGFRLQAVVLAAADAESSEIDIEYESDHFQASAELFVHATLGAGFVRTSVVVNLDEPLGFGFDTGRVWALHVGGGAEL